MGLRGGERNKRERERERERKRAGRREKERLGIFTRKSVPMIPALSLRMEGTIVMKRPRRA